MSTDGTTHDAGRKLRLHARLAVATLVIGLVLMVFMITTESEPGALPLLLVVAGTGWYLVTRRRIRSHRG
jgi:hypothetical protein